MQMNTIRRAARRKGLRFAAGLFLFLPCMIAAAENYYQHPAEFLDETFGGNAPEASLVWLTGERGEAVKRILGHRPASLRVRYWRKGERSAWVLEEVGREELITAGFVVDGGKLVNVRTLAFRESRGWEIRYDFFTNQFKGAGMTREYKLDRHIDNITGATLSVNAMKRMARVALYLDVEVRNDAP